MRFSEFCSYIFLIVFLHPSFVKMTLHIENRKYMCPCFEEAHWRQMYGSIVFKQKRRNALNLIANKIKCYKQNKIRKNKMCILFLFFLPYVWTKISSKPKKCNFYKRIFVGSILIHTIDKGNYKHCISKTMYFENSWKFENKCINMDIKIRVKRNKNVSMSGTMSGCICNLCLCYIGLYVWWYIFLC